MLFLTLFVVPPTSLCAPEDLKDGDINVKGNASAVSGLIRHLYLGDKHLPHKIQSSASLSTCSESLGRRRHHKQHTDLSKYNIIFSSTSIPTPAMRDFQITK